MKRMTKKALVLSAVMALVFAGTLFVGCSRQSTGEQPRQAAGGEGQTNTHAIVFKNTGNPYGEKQMSGFEDGIREQGGTAILRAPDLPTAEAQIQIIDQLIAQRVASICIVGNDFDALQPVLTKAKNAGIKVYSLDSGVNPASRLTHVNQADSEKIGQTLVEAAYELAGGSGEIAILSATSQAANQNLWIEYMQKELALSKYSGLNLVKIAYGDDLRDKSVSETEALLLSYPNLKVIVAPTTVGIAAAGKVITDRGLQGTVLVTGLGLPSEMAEYIDNGACPQMYLWNPIDVGYLGSYVATSLTSGKITGKEGEKFSAGRLGEYTIVKAPDGGTEVLLGPPFRFDKSNIDEWKSVY
ncbi:MAG: rhamnose ABC transporter substrate-binding protein [Spirochaetaceae bacterium]|jgi:rhamnose transport system substrate-binding protein|nr:rhamnose ABC transporter substrate-binding protein [Spirochaetaceae bacterium]